MRQFLFSVYDAKADNYSPPFAAVTKAAAMRMFSDLANDPSTTICKHPEDYTLKCIGTFDDAIGGVLPLQEFNEDAKAYLAVPAESMGNALGYKDVVR